MPTVNASEMIISHDPRAVLDAPSIGSGIGVAVYDPIVQAGAIVHFLLPDASGLDPEKAARFPYTFAESGMRLFLQQLYAGGLQKANLKITVAGGAQPVNPSGFLKLGQRNYETVAKILGEHGLAIGRSEIGGHVARSIYLAIGSGDIRIEIRGRGTRAL